MGHAKNSGAAYTGGSGQVVVMGELLHRKCNVAIPLIDVGTDVFAFRDDSEEVARIQVKTDQRGMPYVKQGYSARFTVPTKQLGLIDSPPLFYAFAVRLKSGWGSFIVISRAKLQELRDTGCGSENTQSGDLVLHIQFRPEKSAVGGELRLTAVCSDVDMTEYINAWESLPPLSPLAPIDPPVDEIEPEPPQA